MTLRGRFDGDRWQWLDHPLIGRQRHLSAIAMGFCIIQVVLTVLSVGLFVTVIDDLPRWTLQFVDAYSWTLILTATLSATILPVIYALLNGGALVAVAIAVTPYLTASTATLDFTLTNDVVVALTGAAIGASVATAVNWYLDARTADTMIPDRGDFDGLLVSSGFSILGLAAVWRFDQHAPADIVAMIDPAHWVIWIPLLGCLGLWVLFLGIGHLESGDSTRQRHRL